MHRKIRHQKALPKPAMQSCAGARLYLSILCVSGLLALGVSMSDSGLLIDSHYVPHAALFIIGVPWVTVFFGHAKTWLAGGRNTSAFSEKAPSTDGAWPSITILLPVYGEANMMTQLADMLHRLDYPPDRLACMILLEADDHATIAALKTAWPDYCRLMSVPPHGPQTKARACNYALRRCRTDLLVIFDAEDKPHPQQLREAAMRFYRADKTLACLQAPLHIQPEQGRWLQLQFALEYRLLFGFILPGLSAACASLPLGGSSNYFRTDRLLTLGGWDDHNLTEDADLGMRLAQAGYHTEMLTLPTIENAPHELVIWMPQRTRWLSGHMQTVHVHALPRKNLRSLPAWAVCMCVLLARLISGPMHALMLISLLRFANASAPLFETDLFMGLAGAVYSGLICLLIIYSPARTWWGRIGLALSHPFYWLLTLPALLFAVKRMAFNQTDWLKSTHVPYKTEGRGWSG